MICPFYQNIIKHNKMRIILLIICSISFYHNASAQNNWASIGTEWYYSLPDENGNPLYSYEKYTSIKDTVIEGKTCKIVKSPYSMEVMYEENNRVFYRFGESFKLIYDFGANIGDTVSFDFKSYSPGSLNVDTTYTVACIVSKIDTLLVENAEIKQYFTSIIPIEGLDHLVWPTEFNYRERMGYEFDFMFVLSIPSLGFMHNLRCFNDYDINYTSDWWKSQNKLCDFSLLTALQNKNALESLTVYPNPVIDELTIRSALIDNMNNFKVLIFDNAGRKILDETMHNPSQKIDIQSLSSGMYYLSVIYENHFFKPHKIVKL